MMNLQRRFTYTINFTSGQALLIALLLLFGAYLGWEIYWWNQIGLYFIKWHTHIVFTALLFGVLLFVPVYVFSFFKKGVALKKVSSVAIALWAVLLFLEFLFILTRWNKTYSEKRWGYCQSPFQPDAKNYYHIYNPGDTITHSAPEFAFTIHYNSLGYLGNEWHTEKDSNRLRLITLGDSFTEGDGAPMDSAYPALMQNMLGDKFEVLNAGVRGSDPVFGIKNFEDRLLNYKPDVVVQAVSENDVLFDMCIRGGYERFQKDSTVKFNSSPAWEPIYAMSYVSRLFFHAFGMNMSEPCGSKNNPALIAHQNLLLKEVFDRYEKTAAEHSIKLLFVFYPTKFEVFRDAYDFDFSQAKKHLDKLPHLQYIDLFPCYRNTIQSDNKKAADYYWKIDGHHNSTGYKMMAACIAEKVKKIAASDTIGKAN